MNGVGEPAARPWPRGSYAKTRRPTARWDRIGVDGYVLAEREQLAGCDTESQGGGGVGRELPLGVASRSQDRDGRPFAGRAVKLGSRERAAERAGDHRLVHVRPHGADLGKRVGSRNADQTKVFTLATDVPRPGRSPAEDRQISIASGNRHDTRIAHLIKQQTTSAGSPCEMYRRDYRASTHREGRRRGCRASGPTSEGAGQLPDNCLAVAGRNRQSELL